MITEFIQSICNLDVDTFPLPQPEGAQILTIKKLGIDVECTVRVGSENWLLTIKNCKTYSIVNEESFQADFYETHLITTLWEDDQFDLSFHGPKGRGYEVLSKLLKVINDNLGCTDNFVLEKLGVYSLDRIISLLDGGFGILLNGPSSVVDMISCILDEAGFECGKSLTLKSKKINKFKALRMRNSWFIGEHFSAKPNN